MLGQEALGFSHKRPARSPLHGAHRCPMFGCLSVPSLGLALASLGPSSKSVLLGRFQLTST